MGSGTSRVDDTGGGKWAVAKERYGAIGAKVRSVVALTPGNSVTTRPMGNQVAPLMTTERSEDVKNDKKSGPKKAAGMPILEDRAVSLELLEELTKKHNLSTMATWEVVEKMVKPKTKKAKLCFAHQLIANSGRPEGPVDSDGSPGIGPATFFVSHAWGFNFNALLDVIRLHADSVGAEKGKTYYWLDIFAVNQHNPKGDLAFERVIKASGHTLVVLIPWDKPRPVTRVWCLYEWDATIAAHATLELFPEKRFWEMPPNTDLAAQQQFFLQTVIKQIDVAKAQATVEADRKRILGDIKKRYGFDDFNQTVRLLLNQKMTSALERLADTRKELKPAALAELRAQIESKSQVYENTVGFNAMSNAIKKKKYKLLATLAKSVNPETSAVGVAHGSGDVRAIEVLLDNSFEATVGHLQRIVESAGHGSPKFATALVEMLMPRLEQLPGQLLGAMLNTMFKHQKVECVERLLDAGAKPAPHLLWVAAHRYREDAPEELDLMLKAGKAAGIKFDDLLMHAPMKMFADNNHWETPPPIKLLTRMFQSNVLSHADDGNRGSCLRALMTSSDPIQVLQECLGPAQPSAVRVLASGLQKILAGYNNGGSGRFYRRTETAAERTTATGIPTTGDTSAGVKLTNDWKEVWEVENARGRKKKQMVHEVSADMTKFVKEIVSRQDEVCSALSADDLKLWDGADGETRSGACMTAHLGVAPEGEGPGYALLQATKLPEWDDTCRVLTSAAALLAHASPILGPPASESTSLDVALFGEQDGRRAHELNAHQLRRTCEVFAAAAPVGASNKNQKALMAREAEVAVRIAFDGHMGGAKLMQHFKPEFFSAKLGSMTTFHAAILGWLLQHPDEAKFLEARRQRTMAGGTGGAGSGGGKKKKGAKKSAAEKKMEKSAMEAQEMAEYPPLYDLSAGKIGGFEYYIRHEGEDWEEFNSPRRFHPMAVGGINHEGMAKLLAAHDAVDVTEADSRGWRAIHYAAVLGHARDAPAVVDFLLAHGAAAHVNEAPARGFGPPLLAASAFAPEMSRSSAEVVKTLIGAGADVDSRGWGLGLTPLLAACGGPRVHGSGSLRTVSNTIADLPRHKILQCESDGHITNNFRYRLKEGPYTYGYSYDHRNAADYGLDNPMRPGPTVLQALLEGGADPGCRDDAGRNAFHYWAKAGRCPETPTLLAAAMRKRGQDASAAAVAQDRDGVTPMLLLEGEWYVYSRSVRLSERIRPELVAPMLALGAKLTQQPEPPRLQSAEAGDVGARLRFVAQLRARQMPVKMEPDKKPKKKGK